MATKGSHFQLITPSVRNNFRGEYKGPLNTSNKRFGVRAWSAGLLEVNSRADKTCPKEWAWRICLLIAQHSNSATRTPAPGWHTAAVSSGAWQPLTLIMGFIEHLGEQAWEASSERTPGGANIKWQHAQAHFITRRIDNIVMVTGPQPPLTST
eukprot:1146738-Pelagomonas_calceolata.AAC.4